MHHTRVHTLLPVCWTHNRTVGHEVLNQVPSVDPACSTLESDLTECVCEVHFRHHQSTHACNSSLLCKHSPDLNIVHYVCVSDFIKYNLVCANFSCKYSSQHVLSGWFLSSTALTVELPFWLDMDLYVFNIVWRWSIVTWQLSSSDWM